jgi:hypothetical protein
VPLTLGPNGELIEVDAVPDRVARPAAQGTIQASLENQLTGQEPLVQLVDDGGNVYDVGENGVDAALSSGRYRLATGREVANYDAIQKRSGGVDTLKTLGESLAAGVADVPLAAGRLVGAAFGEDMSDVTGRQFLSNLFSLGGDVDYEERARERAMANEDAAFAGNLAGGLAAGFGLGKGLSLVEGGAAALTGSRAIGTAASAAVEGGLMGASQASEEAFLGDTELTAEQTLAGMGLGALLGGGVGLGLGAGKAFFGRRGSTPVDGPRLAPSARGDQALEDVAGRVLGPDVKVTPGLGQNLREAVETAQSAVAGVERDALGEVGATRGFLDPKSGAYRKRGLWWNRDRIWAESTDQLTRELEQAADDASDVFDVVVDSGLKREAVLPKLTGDHEAMVRTARAELAGVREKLSEAIARSDDFGNTALLQRQLKHLDSVSPDFSVSRAMGAEAREMAASGNIALDKTKRALQKNVMALRTSASRSGDPLQQMQARQLADFIEGAQERVRLNLEDSNIWGQAGDAQKAINGKWGEYLRTQQLYREGFLKRVDQDYETGRAIFRVDPEKVGRYIRATGRKEGALLDEYFRRHVDAREALAKEISGQFATKGDELARVSESTSTIKKTLAALDETARAVNQVDSIIEAEKSGLAGAFGGGAVLGGVIGGVPGALLGAGMQAVSRPGAMIRSAAAIEQLARNVNAKIDLGVKDFFRRTAQPLGAKARKALEGARTTGRVAGRALPVATSMTLFRGKETDNQKAYQRRAGEVLAATQDFGAGIRDRATTALADLPSSAPKLSANLATTATKGAEFLKSKLPAPLHNTKSLTPKSVPVTVSDLEIQQFARYWSAVTNPLSVLDDLRRGDCTKEQVEALQAVYPKLYDQIQNTVRTQLMELDEQRVLVPYQARLQLDLLLDLNGAGEPTATVEFMTRFQEIAANQPQGGNAPQPQPPAKPLNFASRLRSGSDTLNAQTNGET